MRTTVFTDVTQDLPIMYACGKCSYAYYANTENLHAGYSVYLGVTQNLRNCLRLRIYLFYANYAVDAVNA
jgi:hypothetical protein